MRFRVSVAFSAAICVAVLLLLYQFSSLPPDHAPVNSNKVDLLSSRLQHLEKDISKNHKTVEEIHSLLKNINGGIALANSAEKRAGIGGAIDAKGIAAPPASILESLSSGLTQAIIKEEDCKFAASEPSTTDILMESVVDSLPFDNVDGGVWKQGWELKAEPSRFTTDRPLKVFVVPHSHNDPGWIKTFSEYYRTQTKQILDNMVEKLPVDNRRKFIWAEISYFSLWWEDQDQRTKDIVHKLLKDNQLEIVTGGWVMPDEAVTHYWAVVDQLVTGHQWMANNIDVKPSTGWSIDPFGVTPTMAYILKRAGLDNMLVQRTHYSIKKYLAQQKSLEYRWRQTWDPASSTDMLCHMMPFYSYDVPHTCGPEPAVCCQFDFKRLQPSRVNCPWRKNPRAITTMNVQERAETLLDQYRKKSQLFKTNTLLVPLGDDFRYDTGQEWDQQFENYQLLFDYMNSQGNLHVEAQFGTLTDYFKALREESKTQMSNIEEGEEAFFPSLAGDFFSYADRDDHYWTGYFTSRPYYKARSRQLAASLRAADILLSLERGSSAMITASLRKSLTTQLATAHTALGLFQHHDGITGTAKDHVVLDYANMLLKGLQAAAKVTQLITYHLLTPGERTVDTMYLTPTEELTGASAVTTQRLVTLASPAMVYVYNPHPRITSRLVTIRVDSPYVKVLSPYAEAVVCQVDPVLDGTELQYDVHFAVQLPPLSLQKFTLFGLDANNVDRKFLHFSRVTFRNKNGPVYPLPAEFTVNHLMSSDVITMNAGDKELHIDSNGLLEKVSFGGFEQRLAIQFVSYNARSSQETSGAYLFFPSGAAKVVDTPNSPSMVIEGPLRSLLSTEMPLLTHTLSVSNCPGVVAAGLEIRNLVNIRSERNFELAMRLVTTIDNDRTFYTDLNGFQMSRRVRHEKLTLQGNYYPIASQAFIEDASGRRLTLLTGQPHGGGSLTSGHLEVMQDRRLMQDDNRGLQQGVTDNVATPNVFRLLLERRPPSRRPEVLKQVYPSLLAELSLEDLLYAPVVMFTNSQTSGQLTNWQASLDGAAPSKGDLRGEKGVPCDVQLLSLRSLEFGAKAGSAVEDGAGGAYEERGGAKAGAVAALTLRRTAFDCSFPAPEVACSTTGGETTLNTVVGPAFSEAARHTSLTFLHPATEVTKAAVLQLKPMELYAFLMYSR